jgi:FkbM family methyltransferase
MDQWFGRRDAAPPAAGSREQLFADQRRLAGAGAGVVFDVGAQHGQNALQYYEDFRQARIYAFEPAPANVARIQRTLGPKADRIEVIATALAEQPGEIEFNLNSHDGTHSRLAIGDMRYWQQPATTLEQIKVPATTIDAFMTERGIDDIDLLSMDIQGGELATLRGASQALAAGRIGLIALEVNFKPIYRDLPLFWDLGALLAGHGYNLLGLYDCVHAPDNSNVLSWADALFVGPRHQKISG